MIFKANKEIEYVRKVDERQREIEFTTIIKALKVVYELIIGYLFSKDGYSLQSKDGYVLKAKDQ